MKTSSTSAGSAPRDASIGFWVQLTTAAAAVCALINTGVSAAATVSAAAGGEGGVRYHVGCRDGEVLVGLVMRAKQTAPLVQWLDSAYPQCVGVTAGGDWTQQSPIAYPKLAVGGWSAIDQSKQQLPAATSQNSRTCGSGWAVVGFRGYEGLYIDRLELACQKLTGPGATTGPISFLKMFPDTTSPPIPVSYASCGNFRFEMKAGETLAQLLVRVGTQVAGNVVCLNPANWRTVTTSITPPAVLAKELGGPTPIGNQGCPSGRAATGIYGRAGAAVAARYVDSLGLKCIDAGEWRPGYHFSPPKGVWMNDPAGLVYTRGAWHFHYQAILDSSPVSDLIFGADKMKWGHATSSNLVKWTDHATAFDAGLGLLGADEAPFTGSAVVLEDTEEPCHCSAGSCIAAVFTRHRLPAGPQRQVVATSCSGGPFTPAKPPKVVLEATPNPPWQPFQFRDPKIVAYGGTASIPAHWLMAVAAGDKVKLYRSCSSTLPSSCSRSLLSWQPVTDIQIPVVIPLFQVVSADKMIKGPFFETPDLVRLPVQNKSGESRWVLLFAKGWMPPFVAMVGQKEYSASWYQVYQGDPGTSGFRAAGPPRRLDAGPDFYAPQTWFIDPVARPASLATVTGPIPTGSLSTATKVSSPGPAVSASRHVLGGWQNNWRYAHESPTSPWKGQAAFPRELSLVDENGQYFLRQQPVAELSGARSTYRAAGWQLRNVPVVGSHSVAGFDEKQFEAQLLIEIPNNVLGIKVHVRDGTQLGKVIVGWRRSDSRVYIDRSSGYSGGGSAPDGFSQTFYSDQVVPLESGNLLRLRLLVDRSSVEVFGGDGRVTMSALFFPDPANKGFKISIETPTVVISGVPQMIPVPVRIVEFDLYRLQGN